MERKPYDRYFLDLVKVVATRSTCLRRSCGCVLINHRRHVLATGYNGVAAGMPHCNVPVDVPKQVLGHGIEVVQEYVNACEGATLASGQGLDKCEAIHAEQNALLQCRDVWDIDTCYVSASPCIHCMKLLLNTSCRRIVYAERYPSDKAIQLWNKAGRIIDQC